MNWTTLIVIAVIIIVIFLLYRSNNKPKPQRTIKPLAPINVAPQKSNMIAFIDPLGFKNETIALAEHNLGIEVKPVLPTSGGLSEAKSEGITTYVSLSPISPAVVEWFSSCPDCTLFLIPSNDMAVNSYPENIIQLPQKGYRDLLPEIVKKYPKITLFTTRKHAYLSNVIQGCKVVNFKGTNTSKISKILNKMTRSDLCIPLLESSDDLQVFRALASTSSGTFNVLEVGRIKPVIDQIGFKDRYFWLTKHVKSNPVLAHLQKDVRNGLLDADLYNSMIVANNKNLDLNYMLSQGLEGYIFDETSEFILLVWNGADWQGSQFFGRSNVIRSFSANVN
uniref:Uncharacterized protein n=1 Tax=viral metagenome TaxID=1070528 RepID=A0A6C0BKB9_9ZZZZ